MYVTYRVFEIELNYRRQLIFSLFLRSNSKVTLLYRISLYCPLCVYSYSSKHTTLLSRNYDFRQWTQREIISRNFQNGSVSSWKSLNNREINYLRGVLLFNELLDNKWDNLSFKNFELNHFRKYDSNFYFLLRCLFHYYFIFVFNEFKLNQNLTVTNLSNSNETKLGTKSKFRKSLKNTRLPLLVSWIS